MQDWIYCQPKASHLLFIGFVKCLEYKDGLDFNAKLVWPLFGNILLMQIFFISMLLRNVKLQINNDEVQHVREPNTKRV